MELRPRPYNASGGQALSQAEQDCRDWFVPLHNVGTAALAFIPFVGPVLAAAAVAFTPQIVGTACNDTGHSAGWSNVDGKTLFTFGKAAADSYAKSDGGKNDTSESFSFGGA